jgi:uncharacterized DUF497 family protein
VPKYPITWDENKNKLNFKKHGITFIEAATVFDDDGAVYLYDGSHSYNEDRFNVIGLSEQLNMLVVCHCYTDNETVTRIISARKASKNESDIYGGV